MQFLLIVEFEPKTRDLKKGCKKYENRSIGVRTHILLPSVSYAEHIFSSGYIEY